MTDSQKMEIIELYNHSFQQELDAENRMDSGNDKVFAKASEDHAAALARQSAIDDVLQTLGYSLVREERFGGFLVDIVRSDKGISV